MRNTSGFTLVEVLIFLVVSGILMSTILLSMISSVRKEPVALQNMIANQTARKCMEWFVGQRQLNGYGTFSCPSTSVPSYCTAPSGFTVAVNITCTTINTDASYKTITVTVSGKGDSKMSTLVASY